jgi:hypothetical protein
MAHIGIPSTIDLPDSSVPERCGRWTIVVLKTVADRAGTLAIAAKRLSACTLSSFKMAATTSFESNVLARICGVLDDFDTRLTGSEIGRLLKNLQIADPCQE